MELETHHSVPSYIQKVLKENGDDLGALDDCPGWLVTREKHTMADGLHSKIDAIFKGRTNYRLQEVIEKLPQAYRDAGLDEVAVVVKQWLLNRKGTL